MLWHDAFEGAIAPNTELKHPGPYDNQRMGIRIHTFVDSPHNIDFQNRLFVFHLDQQNSVFADLPALCG